MLGSPLVGRRSCRGRPPEAAWSSSCRRDRRRRSHEACPTTVGIRTSESCCSTCPTRRTPSSKTRARGSRAPALWSIPPTSSPRVTATVNRARAKLSRRYDGDRAPLVSLPLTLQDDGSAAPPPLTRSLVRPPGSRAGPGTPGRPPHVSKATQKHFLTTSDGSRRRHVIPVAGLRASGGSGSSRRG